MGQASRRRMSIVKSGAAAFAALAVCSTALSEDASPQQAIQSLQDEIHFTETQDPNSADLIGPLAALGLLYQESGKPVLAMAALGQAVHVVRFNYGLYSLEQAPLVRQSIVSAEAAGDHQTAWDLEKGLVRLALRHADDPRTATIFRDTADRRMDILAKYKAGELPPEVTLGCYYAGPHPIVDLAPVPDRNCTSGSAGAVRLGLAMEARHYYSRAVDILLRTHSYSSEDLPPLFMDLVAISYDYGDPSIGRKSLNYLLAYQASNSAPWRDRVDTLVQIADWDLLHAVGLDELNAALAEYAQAYALLERKGGDPESIRALFAPETPVALPVSGPHRLLADAQREDSGYVDAAFDVDKYGRSRRVRIVETTPDATRAAAKHVENVILRSRFRPRLVDGRVADHERVVVRYPVADQLDLVEKPGRR